MSALKIRLKRNPLGLFLCSHRIFVWAMVVTSAMGQTENDRYPVVIDGKVGFVDQGGNEVIGPQFFPLADMAHFSEGLAPVVSTEGGGYIDASGRFVIGPTKDWGQPREFHDGVAGVLIWGKNGARNTPALIDRSGRVILAGSDVAEGTYFSEGLMPFRERGGWGFVDKSLQWVIPVKYSWAGEFSDGLVPVRSGTKFGYVDRSGKDIVPPRYDLAWAFSDGLGRVRIDVPTGTRAMTMEGLKPIYRELYGFVDRYGGEAIPLRFEWATDFHDGYAFAKLPGSPHLAILDRQGTIVSEALFEKSGEFREGLAAACIDGKWGYVDHQGTWVIKPQFIAADGFWHGLARVTWKDGGGYVDRSGAIVWKLADKLASPATPK